jgi:hypothetical protein
MIRAQHALNDGHRHRAFLLLLILLLLLLLLLLFGPKRDEMMGEWRKLHNEKLRDLYSSPSIIRIIKSKRMRWPM